MPLYVPCPLSRAGSAAQSPRALSWQTFTGCRWRRRVCPRRSLGCATKQSRNFLSRGDPVANPSADAVFHKHVKDTESRLWRSDFVRSCTYFLVSSTRSFLVQGATPSIHLRYLRLGFFISWYWENPKWSRPYRMMGATLRQYTFFSIAITAALPLLLSDLRWVVKRPPIHSNLIIPFISYLQISMIHV